MTMIEHLKDPLTHIVRNAIDHGIESPAARRQAGKDPCGTIVLSARHEAGCIVIRASDDGAGLDRKAIAELALARGIASETKPLSAAETDDLVFEPGFTTTTTVSELSGRGVGLDVVKRNVETLRGAVSIESRQGRARP